MVPASPPPGCWTAWPPPWPWPPWVRFRFIFAPSHITQLQTTSTEHTSVWHTENKNVSVRDLETNLLYVVSRVHGWFKTAQQDGPGGVPWTTRWRPTRSQHLPSPAGSGEDCEKIAAPSDRQTTAEDAQGFHHAATMFHASAPSTNNIK